METIVKVICCIILAANGKVEERYFTLNRSDKDECFYEIHKSEAIYIKNTHHIPVDTQVIKTKPFILARR